ncbi:AAA family ATPase [Mycolicibacterium poriferae]|uniref:AAA family ATPase n=1 Tax=Mycolicibacterium poriferae TaxID=39694 RepID=UPI0024BB52B6|nr:AAA family ATPase [Mycolicibacterium poriferae]
MVAGDWQPHVPAATIGRPRIARGVIHRPALVQHFLPAQSGLVTVTAPAGYGKTTAVAQWDASDERPFAWARVDQLDDDATHLLLHIATAVQGIYGVDRGLLAYLRGPGRAPLTHLVPALVQCLEVCPPLVLVLDDAHELCTPEAVETLRVLIDAAPPSTTVAVVGRYLLPLEVARRRLQQSVVEVGPTDLRFTDDESAAALKQICGARSDETVATVVNRCEGWPAGVVLSGMALRDGADVASVTGRHSAVTDFLVEEILERLDGDTATFLLESSVLERFRADQLDEVLGRDDSASKLATLRASGNSFLVPLDDRRRWYRYHRLFGDALRTTYRAWSPLRFREMAVRASELLERDGDVDSALLRALDAGDRGRAAALVGRDAVRLGFDGRAGVLARRLGLLDARTFAEYPDAAVARAWLGVTRGDAELIHRSLLLAHRADEGLGLSDGTPSVRVAAALISSLVGVGGVHDVIRHADVVVAEGDPLTNPWWGAATVMKGAAESMIGHMGTARVLLESALAVTDDLPGFKAAALAHLALIDLQAGDDDAANVASLAARELADKYDLCDLVPMVVVYATSAVMSARYGDADAAHQAVQITESLLDQLGHLAARTALLGHGLLAWSGVVIGDTELMARHLEAAERDRRREPDAVALSQRVDRVREMAVRGARPLTAAELKLLPRLATHMSLQKIADELVIGRETAKSQATSIYRKLGVSSRSAAVAEARRIGLLWDQ